MSDPLSTPGSSLISLRSQAVETVDARHGYTYEFSNTPGMHLAEYDAEEAALVLEARANALVEYGNSLPDGVTTEAFAEAANLRREARRLRA